MSGMSEGKLTFSSSHDKFSVGLSDIFDIKTSFVKFQYKQSEHTFMLN